ncbi:MAG: 2-hydroxyacyl-CoA dehydratase family protein [Bacillota bacterium]
MNSIRHKMDLTVRMNEAQKEAYMADYIKGQLSVLDAILNGEGYLCSTFYIPNELFELFEVLPLFIERFAGFAAACKVLSHPVREAVTKGLPNCGCSYQMLFDLLLRKGLIPKPEGFVASSFTCDDAWMYSYYASIRNKVPFFFLDINNRKNDTVRKYIAARLEELYSSFSTKYKKKSSIKEVIAASNKAIEIKNKIDNLRMKYPRIISSVDAFKMFTIYNDLGKQSAVDVLQQFYNKVCEKASFYEAKEKPKLLWLGLLPLYRNTLILEIEKKYDCQIAFEEIFQFPSNTIEKNNLFQGLAERIMESVYFSLNQRTENLLKKVKDFDIDGVIHFSQNKCKFLPPSAVLLRRKLEAEGLPFVEIFGDAIDMEFYNENRLWDSMDIFFEQIYRRYRNVHMH